MIVIQQFTACKQLFLEHLERQHYLVKTSDGYGKDLESFRRFMAERLGVSGFAMDVVGKAELLAFMDHGRSLGHRPSTVGRRLSTLKSFYKFLVYELDYPVDVAARIRIPKVYTPLQTILSEEEVRRLLQSAEQLHPRYALLFNMLYHTGSRLSPVRLLEKGHVHLQDKIVYFPKVKGGKDLYLPLSSHLVALLEQYLSIHCPRDGQFVFPSSRCADQPISASDVRNKLRWAARKAGVNPRITPHTLRHCTATHLTIRNVPQHKIASILGHSDLRSTIRYQHLAVDHLREALDLL